MYYIGTCNFVPVLYLQLYSVNWIHVNCSGFFFVKRAIRVQYDINACMYVLIAVIHRSRHTAITHLLFLQVYFILPPFLQIPPIRVINYMSDHIWTYLHVMYVKTTIFKLKLNLFTSKILFLISFNQLISC